MIAIRASSLADLFDCALRWQARNLLHLSQPTAGAAHLGTSIHAGTAAYDQASLLGAPIAIDEAAGVLVDTLHHPEQDVVWDAAMTPAKAEPIALALLTRYCETIAPERDYVAVEARCDDLVIDVDGYRLGLTGTVDRVRRETDGALGISDLKTGKTAVSTEGVVAAGKHAVQLGAYEILAQHSIGRPMEAPAEVIGLQTNGKARVGSGTIERPRDILIGGEDHKGLLQFAAEILRSGLFSPNNRSLLCAAAYCPLFQTCPYRR